MKTLVVGRRHPEDLEQRTIAPPRSRETAIDERHEIVARELTLLERLVYHRPEIFSVRHPVPYGVYGRCVRLVEGRREVLASARACRPVRIAHFRRQIAWRDRPSKLAQGQALGDIAHLANVARPGVLQ